MPGYQFIHVECYSRRPGKGKAGGHSISSVLAEARRDPDACPHIESPLSPMPIFGDIATVEAAAFSWAAQAQDTRGHRLRADGLCLLAGVLSAPPDLRDWEGFKRDSLAFLRTEYGDRLRAVVEHVDEKSRHLHFYAIPRRGERFSTVHRGRAAAEEAKAQGKPKGLQNTGYIEAMRGMQDSFWERVGKRHGLARIGPRRRRLTRAEWKAEQKVGALLACEERRLEQTAEQVADLQRQIQEKEKEIQAMKKQLSVGDVAVILGDEWAKKEIGEVAAKDKLARASEPAPVDWQEKARQAVEAAPGGSLIARLKKTAPEAEAVKGPGPKKGSAPGM